MVKELEPPKAISSFRALIGDSPIYLDEASGLFAAFGGRNAGCAGILNKHFWAAIKRAKAKNLEFGPGGEGFVLGGTLAVGRRAGAAEIVFEKIEGFVGDTVAWDEGKQLNESVQEFRKQEDAAKA